RLDGVAGTLANDVELALQRIGHGDARATAHEYLADDGLELLRRLGKVGIVHRHVAPAEQHLAFVLDRALNLVLAGVAARRVARQEDHPDAVLPRWRKMQAARCHL